MTDDLDCCPHALDERRSLSLDRRNWDTVLCQKLPQAVVFLSQAVTFPLRGLKLSLKFFAGHKRTVILPISELFCAASAGDPVHNDRVGPP